MTKLDALHSSNRMDWESPSWVFSLMNDFAGGGWFDPCPPGGKDGLVSWEGRGNVAYMNPPYGREIPKWISHACDMYERHGIECIALVPSRTDTRWMHDNWDRFSAVCWVKGRVTFEGAKHAAPFPSIFIYVGNDVAKFNRVFCMVGRVDVYV